MMINSSTKKRLSPEEQFAGRIRQGLKLADETSTQTWVILCNLQAVRPGLSGSTLGYCNRVIDHLSMLYNWLQAASATLQNKLKKINEPKNEYVAKRAEVDEILRKIRVVRTDPTLLKALDAVGDARNYQALTYQWQDPWNI